MYVPALRVGRDRIPEASTGDDPDQRVQSHIPTRPISCLRRVVSGIRRRNRLHLHRCLRCTYVRPWIDTRNPRRRASMDALPSSGGGGTCRFHARSWRRKANGRPGSASPPNMRFTLPPARSWYVAADTLGVLRLSSYCR